MSHDIYTLLKKKPKLLDMAVCSRNCRQDLPLRLPYTESLKRGECHASFLAAATKYRRFNSAVPVVSLFAYPWGRHRITKQRLFFFFFFGIAALFALKPKPYLVTSSLCNLPLAQRSNTGFSNMA